MVVELKAEVMPDKSGNYNKQSELCNYSIVLFIVATGLLTLISASGDASHILFRVVAKLALPDLSSETLKFRTRTYARG